MSRLFAQVKRGHGFWRLVAAVAVLTACAAAATPVLAHAVIVRSDPADGAVLGQPPQRVRLWFSEPINPKTTQVQLVDARGDAVTGLTWQAAAADPTLVEITLPELAPGLFNLAYSTLSAADGHPTRDHLVFRIAAPNDANELSALRVAGVPTTPGVAGAPNGSGFVSESLLRGLEFAALIALVGALWVHLLLLRPAALRLTADAPEAGQTVTAAALLAPVRQRVRTWAAVCALAALALGLLSLYENAAILSLPGGAPGALVSAVRLLLASRTGALWIGREVALALIAGLLAVRKGSTWGDAAAATLSVAVLALQALSGHAAAAPDAPLVAPLMDLLHLFAASLWVGGLAALAVGALPLALRAAGTPAFAALLRACWQPFGRIAALGVGLLIATGLYAAVAEVGSLPALFATFYGRSLAAKVLLVAGAGAAGGLNSLALHPRLAAPLTRLVGRDADWTPVPLRRLPALIGVELAFGAGALLLTGVLTSSPPARVAMLAAEVGAKAGNQPVGVAPVSLVRPADDLIINLEVKPNLAGENVILVRVADTRRPPPAPILRVILRFTYLDRPLGTVSTNAQEIAAGTYQVAGSQLSAAGRWQVDVAVRRKGLEDTTASFDWSVAPPGR